MKILRRLFRWSLLIIVVLVLLELGGFALNRILSQSRSVTLRQFDFPIQTLPISGHLKLATYNICRGKGDESNSRSMDHPAEMFGRLDAIADLLVAEQPDIVVLEELDFDCDETGRINQAEYIARKSGYPYVVEQKDIDANTLLFFHYQQGNAVLSRYPIRSAQLIPLPGYVAWETILGGKTHGVLCAIELNPKTTIQLFATHLESRSEIVRLESVQIIESLRQTIREPFLVVGDLNTSPKSSLATGIGADKSAIASLYSSGAYKTLPLEAPTAADTTLDIGSAPYVIDWILVPTNWPILEKKVIRSTASDLRTDRIRHRLVATEPANRKTRPCQQRKISCPRILPAPSATGGKNTSFVRTNRCCCASNCFNCTSHIGTQSGVRNCRRSLILASH